MKIEDIFGSNGSFAEKLESYELRPQQIEMALAIEKSIDERKHLIVEAGTGVGKSLAYMVPFIYWAVETNKKVVFSTYTKTLQEQLVSKDLPFLRKVLGAANADTNTGTNKIDFSFALCVGSQNYLCLRRFYQAQTHGLFTTKQENKEFQEIIEWEAQTKNGLRSDLDFEPSQAVWSKVRRESDLCFGKKCDYKDDCHYNRARRREYMANILVTNHHLYFANLVNEGKVLPAFDAVVFDEAHTLEDVATNYLCLETSNTKIRYLLNSILNPKTGKGLMTRLFKPSDTQVTDISNKLNETRGAADLFFSEVIEKFSSRKTTTRIRKKGTITNYLDKPLNELSKMLKSFLNMAGTEEQKMEIDAFADRCDEINRSTSAIINQEQEEFVYWVEVENKVGRQSVFMKKAANSTDTTALPTPLSLGQITGQTKCSLFAAPVSIANEFKKQVFDAVQPVILTSATLTTNGNFEYIKERLGVPAQSPDKEDFVEKNIGTPFDFSKKALIYIPEKMPDPKLKSEFQVSVTKQIKEIISAIQGGTFILFTSFEMLNAVYEELEDEMDSYTLFKQGDKPRYKLIEEFKASPKPVLFGTATFWQGIDVPGRALECVIITKLPFAVPDVPIIEARMELLEAQGKNPFTHFQVPQAIILLRQGFGRLIRTNTDTGIVAILDPRVKTKYYGRHFLNSLPKSKTVTDIKGIEDFFKRVNKDS